MFLLDFKILESRKPCAPSRAKQSTPYSRLEYVFEVRERKAHHHPFPVRVLTASFLVALILEIRNHETRYGKEGKKKRRGQRCIYTPLAHRAHVIIGDMYMCRQDF
jgi:hypothetical protein